MANSNSVGSSVDSTLDDSLDDSLDIASLDASLSDSLDESLAEDADDSLGEDSDLLWNGDSLDNSISGGSGDDDFFGGSGRDRISGGSGHDDLFGQGGNDDLSGDSGNDDFYGGSGDDSMNGGTGRDTAFFTGSRSDYTFAKTAGTLRVSSTREGQDSLVDLERLKFADKKVAFDLSASDDAGEAMLFLGMLAYSGLNNTALRGTLISVFDSGASMKDVCQLAINIGVTSALAGGSSNVDLVKLLYRNIVQSEASNEVANQIASTFLQGSGGSMSQSEFMSAVATLDFNQQHVNLVGLQSTGVEFL